MNPIYKFELTINGTTERAFPVYKDDLSKDYELQSNERFFRAKLSGKLTFESPDYNRIVSAAFDTQFLLEIYISYDAGQTWTAYWSGTFWKTDCDFDDDSKTVTVTPTVNDRYNDVLAGLEKEYNLIDLLPEIVQIKADKRPMVQVYVPGQNVIGCFLSGMWWEQETDPESDESKLIETGDGKLNFALNKSFFVAEVSGTVTPQLPDIFSGSFTGVRFNPTQAGTQSFTNGDYRFDYYFTGGGGGYTLHLSIVRVSDSTTLWYYSESSGQMPDLSLPRTYTLPPVAGSGATGNVELYLHEITVYARLICDTTTVANQPTYELPADDIVPDNRNYNRVIAYYFPDTIYFSTIITSTPNKYGLYQPGQYYQPPYLYWDPELFPVARNDWGRVSIWYTFSAFETIVEQSGREPFMIRYAYPIASVISVLLGQIAPGITHEETTDYSLFLYGENPFTGEIQKLMITPKSNIVSAGYDEPAQKAPITLRTVLDMLRDCFRCYWYIDEENRFRIEHVRYFMDGGSYSQSPEIGVDLTLAKNTRNGKPWAFAKDQYKFNKPEMAARYQFGWMDDVTQLFDGFPIDILAKYVTPDYIEEINVSNFTSDIDYILLNPNEISKDGFVLLSGKPYQSGMVGQTADTTAGGNRFLTDINIPVNEYGKEITLTVRAMGLTGSELYARIFGTDVDFYVPMGLVLQSDEWVSQTATFTLPSNDAGDLKLQWYFISGASFGDTTLEIVGGNISGEWQLPYINFRFDETDHFLQNALVAFIYLQRYYDYDMPAYNYAINGVNKVAAGIKRLKTQNIKFPAYTDPNLLQLIRTNIGDGEIQKLSVNLSGRNANATLIYDTE